jgi:hypothetical protein
VTSIVTTHYRHKRLPRETARMTDQEPAAKEELPMRWLNGFRAWVSLVRDVGLALGVPALIAVGVWLHHAQIGATEAQVKASEAQTKLAEAQNSALQSVLEAQVKAVEAQNTALKETQYDRALALINAQRTLFDQERAEAKRQLDQQRAEASKQVFDEIRFYDQSLKFLKEALAIYLAIYNDPEANARVRALPAIAPMPPP